MREVLALGLMSGTSLDGVDAALLDTDGERITAFGARLTVPYPAALRADLRAVLGGVGPVARVERDITLFHAEVVAQLLEQSGLKPSQVALLGFHGHTILHRPEDRRTWQIGDGALLADRTGIAVVCDFRSADVAEGGQGAPLVPVFHRALARDLDRPLAVLNLGGVGNVTWIGSGGGLLAFDTGPGNALLDDWMLERTGRPFDEDGALASSGRVSTACVQRFLSHSYFAKVPPKSLDRDEFRSFAQDLVKDMTAADGAATLAAFTAAAVAAGVRHFPSAAGRWLVCGGGRRNRAVMAALTAQLGIPPEPVEAVGWDGDALEAQAFAFLAVRAHKGLPLTYPETTGAPAPLCGGRHHPFSGA